MLRVCAAQTETRTGFGVTGRSLACRLTAAHHHQAQRREARTSGCDRRTACGLRSRSLPEFAPRRRPTAGHPRPRCHSSGPAPALPAHTARGSRAAPVADLGGPRRANGVPGATILLCRLSSQDAVRRDAAIMIRGILQCATINIRESCAQLCPEARCGARHRPMIVSDSAGPAVHPRSAAVLRCCSSPAGRRCRPSPTQAPPAALLPAEGQACANNSNSNARACSRFL